MMLKTFVRNVKLNKLAKIDANRIKNTKLYLFLKNEKRIIIKAIIDRNIFIL